MKAHTFRPDRANYIAVGLMTLMALTAISWKPLALGWFLIFPALFLWWMAKSSTTVSEEGITIKYAFSANQEVPWENFKGVGFKGARAFAQTQSDKQLTLPGVSFNSLPQLSAASGGRIIDALTAGHNAADDKVVIIHRDGEQVLLTKEEYASYQSHQSTNSSTNS